MKNVWARAQFVGLVLLSVCLHLGCQTVPIENQISGMTTGQLIEAQQRVRTEARALQAQAQLQGSMPQRKLKPGAAGVVSFSQGYQAGRLQRLAQMDAAISQELARRESAAQAQNKPKTYSEAPGYFWIGEDCIHWIREVSTSMVILEDRSQWDVSPAHEHRIEPWASLDDAKLVRGTSADYPFTIINMERKESVDVRYLGEAQR